MVKQCINPTVLQEGDLLASLDGVASPTVITHIAHCAACQAERAALLSMNSFFDVALYRQPCPEGDMLLAYQAGLLPRQERSPIKQHLADCLLCQQEVAQLAHISTTSELSLWERLLLTGKQFLDALRLPAAPQPAFALLGDEQQQQIYQAGDFQLIISMSKPLTSTNIWQIEGQLINESDPLMQYEGEISLLGESETRARDEIDEFGYFILEKIEHGEYTLLLELPTIIIPIDQITIAT
jgi:hypothetical protein